MCVPVKTLCPICSRPLQQNPQSLVLLFLCRHVVHASCVGGGDQLPAQPDPSFIGIGIGSTTGRGLSGKIALYISLESHFHKSLMFRLCQYVNNTCQNSKRVSRLPQERRRRSDMRRTECKPLCPARLYPPSACTLVHRYDPSCSLLQL